VEARVGARLPGGADFPHAGGLFADARIVEVLLLATELGGTGGLGGGFPGQTGKQAGVVAVLATAGSVGVVVVGVATFQQGLGFRRDAVVEGAAQRGGVALLVGIEAVAVGVAQFLVVGTEVDLRTGALGAEGVHATDVLGVV